MSNVETRNVTVTWSTIRNKRYGIIQKYRARLFNTIKQVVAQTFVKASEERTTTFLGLLPGKTYDVRLCGYTTHPDCGHEVSTGWFKTLPIRKFRVD